MRLMRFKYFPYNYSNLKTSIYLPQSLQTPKQGYFAIALQSIYVYELKTFFKPGDIGMFLNIETDMASFMKHQYIVLLFRGTRVRINSRYLKNLIFTPISQALNGKNVCITGTLRWDRAVYEKLITLNSGEFKTSVSKKTDYLLVGLSPGGTKLDKARQHNITTLTEDEFMKKFFPGGVV